MRPEQNFARMMKARGLSIAFAESMSCGYLSHKIGSISSTSDIFKGAIICYDKSVKTNLMGLSEALIKKHTAESQVITDKLVRKLKLLIKADVHASITGLAAAGGSENRNKPVGTVYYSVLYKNKLTRKKKQFRGSPLEIKKRSCAFLFSFISQIIKSAA